MNAGGSDIGSGGFSLTGNIRFTWPSTEDPKGNDIKADILVGRYNCNYANAQTVFFGNHINGSISGYKLDGNGNPLAGWSVSAYNATRIELYYDDTDLNGYYNISDIPLGYYWLNETPKVGYTQVTPNRTVQINVTTLNLFNQNFTNNATAYCIEGYKIDNCTREGIPGWNISVRIITGAEAGNATTNASGHYRICNLTPGKYILCEEQKPGWINVTPACLDVNITTSNLTNAIFTNTKNLCIEGYKVDSTTQQGLAGWNITITNQTGSPMQVTTGQDGFYRICDLVPGEYQLCEELKSGYLNVTPLCQNVTLNCTNATGVNFTNTEETYCIEGYKIDNCTRQGLDGWTINVYNEALVLIASTTTDSTGFYRICGLSPANYRVCEQVKDGWYQVTPMCVWANITRTNVTNVNFTNQEYLCIEGYKIDNATKLGIPGWTITVRDHTSAVAGTAITNATGWYQICALQSGEYQVCEELKGGYVNVTPLCRNVTLGCTNATNINFTNEPATHCLDGYKYEGLEGSTGLEGWNITVMTATGAPAGTAISNASGYWKICNLSNGSYQVCETLKSGWVNLTPTCYAIVINGADNTSPPFRNELETYCIRGYKIDNCTGRGISSWNISVKNETAVIVATTSTDQNGYYQVCGLLPGTYTVCEELKPDWTNLTPLCLPATITNANVTNVNFTNTQVFCLEGRKISGTTQAGLPGWNITVSNQTGQVATVQTNDTGYYRIYDLVPGPYTVCEELKPGWTNLTPLCQNVVLPCNNMTLNFVNDETTFCIRGYKIDNCTGRGIPSWNISVKNETAVIVATTGTDQNGYYQVCGLLPGTYTVCEELKPGWTNLTPLCQPATITSTNVTNLNFTNTQVFCLEGTKISGTTQTGLSNWNITVSNQTGQVATVQTNATGFYRVCNLVPGPYTVCEELKPGWGNLTPLCQNVILPCSNLTVNFINDQTTFCIRGYKIDNCNGRGIPLWNISVKNETSVVVATTSTDQNGYYQVCGLLPGTYTVCEELQPGWTNLTALCQPAPITSTNVTNVNFTNSRLVCIEGRKFSSSTRIGLPDWNITVSNQIGQVATVQTNDTGYYRVCNLMPGRYTVCEELKDDWTNLTPICQDITLACDNLTVNFANYPTNYCIRGYKIDDCTGIGLPGWNITARDMAGALAGTAVTQGDGSYEICGLLPGTYTVCEELKPGWTNLTPLCQPATITTANVTNLNFTNTQVFCLEGRKISGTTQAGLPNWNITVSNQSGQVATVQTNATGYYQVCNLVPGHYTVCEELKPGWTNLTPACQNIVLPCSNLTVNFANEWNTFCVAGYKIDNCTGRGISSWNISVKNETAVIVATTSTDQNGYYQVCGLLPGTYTVCEELKPGWTNLTPLYLPVIITDANAINVNFTNTRLLCISGNKRQIENDQGLPGWNITVSNQTGQVATVQTNATGYYQVCNLIPGLYTVCEEVQPGWTNVTPACVDIVLACTNTAVDFENDPVIETYCIRGSKVDNCTRTGLPGWNITARDMAGALAGTAVTGSDGTYAICGLLPGTYTVCEELKPGWTNLTPLCLPATITTANVTNVTFTNTQVFCLEGTKISGTTQTGLPNWNVTVSNQTGQVATVQTNATGYYRICNLVPGPYTVCEELKPGWTNLTPLCQNVVLPCNNMTLNFANERNTFCVAGYKIDNCTGRGIPSWNISVKNETAVIVATTSTDQNGYYQVCGLLPGTYTVCEELKPGWTNLTPLCQPATITTASVTNLNFTNTRQGCIEGRKTIGSTSVGVANWNITVKDRRGQDVVKTTTNATGYYRICNLVPGFYTVCEEVQPGWTNLTPDCQNVTLECNNLTVDFANERVTFCIDGFKIDNCTGQGIPSWNISVRNNEGQEIVNTTTTTTGYYRVCGLLPGTYTVCEELKPGWTNITPLCQPATITTANLTSVNFTNTPLGCIEGRKTNGTSGAGLANWNISVRNEAGQNVVKTTTNATGYYRVCGLLPGTYTVCEELKLGFTNVTSACVNINLNCTNNLATVNFANIPAVQNGSITGYKINQSCGCPISGWTIRLYNATSGGLVRMTHTDATGKYSFTGLDFGTYRLNESYQYGWAAVSSPSVQVTISEKNPYAVNINFTNFRSYTCNSSDVINVNGIEKHVICIWDP